MSKEMREAFIRDIATHPEDIERRLIFADWLQDNGEPEWAEFIQSSVLSGDFCDPDLTAHALRKFYLNVLKNLKLVPKGTVLADTIRVRNGFIEEIHAPLGVLEWHLPSLVQEHPLVAVRATDKEPSETRSGWFRWYKSFRATGYTRHDDLPRGIWEWLPEDGKRTDSVLTYPTRESAHAALSRALLKLARQMAGMVVSRLI